MKALILFGAFAACATTDKLETQPAKLGGFAYDAPAEWKHVDSHAPRSVTSTWTPIGDNERKESLVVIRSQIDPALAKGGVDAVEKLLVAAQHELPKLTLSKSGVTKLVTGQGLAGLRIDSEFVPSGLGIEYHRTHLALLDGKTLIHLIYTSRDPDVGEQALVAVLQSIHRGEG